MKNIITISLFVCCAFVTSAQVKFSGKIVDTKGETLPNSQIVLSVKDSIVAATLTDKNGQFLIKNLQKGTYNLEIFLMGFTSIEQKLQLDEDLIGVEFSLMEEMKFTLNEVQVIGDRSNTVERTATGQRFFLSVQSKNSGNPYRALNEIPVLIANQALQKVTMSDGSSPLILVNGNVVNSGIASINPKDIESVEVMDVVSAKYLQKGVNNIINIKLKDKLAPYIFLQTMGRADVPIRQTMGAVYFEIGNSKYSLYSRFAADYTKDDEIENEGWQKGNNYYKSYIEKLLNTKYYQLGELLFKWKTSKKGYFAAHLYVRKNSDENNLNGTGIYKEFTDKEFKYNSLSKNDSYIFTGSLFYKYLFNPNSVLETTFAYNKNNNKDKGKREELYSQNVVQNQYNYDNNRDSYNINIDYNLTWKDINSLNIGSATTFIDDDINMISENVPVFYHKKWNEYLYAAFSSKIDEFRYMVSLGVEGIYFKAGNISNHYWKPRVSLSGMYQFNTHNSIRLSYNLTNTAPNVGTLNPYNTSIDPLVISKGNPKLKPEENHKIKASYTFNTKGIYITPSATYNLYSDIVEPFGYMDNNIYVSTFQNIGKFNSLSLGGSISYKIKKWGQIYANAFHNIDYFSCIGNKKRFSCGGGMMANYKKWTFIADFSWQDYSYTRVSTIKYTTPTFSHLQAIYNFTNNFYISVAMSHSAGTLANETRIYNKDYQSFQRHSMIGQSLRPWILIRYTFRKNRERKINLENKIHSQEDGISL